MYKLKLQIENAFTITGARAALATTVTARLQKPHDGMNE
jgi:hypothetical protein